MSKQWELHWRKSEMHGLLPDPEPRPIRYTLISVDDHVTDTTPTVRSNPAGNAAPASRRHTA